MTLVTDLYWGIRSEEHHLPNPRWSDVEAAVEALDGRQRTSVIYGEMGFETISCSGGPEFFVVQAEGLDPENGDWFASLSGEGRLELLAPTVELIIGGQTAYFSEADVVAKDDALSALRTYFETGEIDRSMRWIIKRQINRTDQPTGHPIGE